MSRRKEKVFFISLAIVGGVLGGFISSKLLVEERISARRGAALKEVIVANEFHLVDEEGKDRWVLALSHQGEPTITFINRTGWAPMAMGVNRNGLPFINMILEPYKNGGPCFILMDHEANKRAELGLRRDGEPYLTLLDRSGQMRAIMGGVELENPITGSTDKRPVSSLVLLDKEGNIVFSAPNVSSIPVHFSMNADGADK
jgi:hypothetical protein